VNRESCKGCFQGQRNAVKAELKGRRTLNICESLALCKTSVHGSVRT
jgi:hypothetical protein